MLSGSPRPARLIQGHLHTDPHAILEDSKSKEFKQAVNSEIARWKSAKKPDYSAWLKQFKDVLKRALPKTKEYAQTSLEWNGQTIHIQNSYNHQHHIWFNNVLKYEGVEQIVLGDQLYAIINDTGKGSEEFTLTVYSENHQPLWDVFPVGPDAAFQGEFLFFQTVENKLRYPGIKKALAKTGEKKTELYHQKDQKIQIELLQPQFQNDIFIKEANALEQRMGLLVGDSEVKWLTKTLPRTVIAASKNTILEDEFLIDAVLFQTTLYTIKVKKGVHTLYANDVVLKTCPAIKFLKHSTKPSVLCEYLWKPSEVYDILENNVRMTMPSLITLDHKEGIIDGIPYMIVFKGKPKKLIVSAYGAYGIESQRGYPIRWLPWLANGYAFAVAMPRGGRDDGDAWWDAARTAPKKHRTFDDTAAVIEHLQKRFGFSPSKTLFYGRSAGGWVSAMMALQHSYLVKGVIAEVPFVDVLRTTSNPKLPLTQLEFEEFGDPLHKKADYEALLKISPVDSTGRSPVKEPTILLKTALNDTQVATYESLKWATVLREKGWSNVYVSIDTEGGHFVGRDGMCKQYAEDAAFFHSVIRGETRKTVSHLSRGTTRRLTSSSKQSKST